MVSLAITLIVLYMYQNCFLKMLLFLNLLNRLVLVRVFLYANESNDFCNLPQIYICIFTILVMLCQFLSLSVFCKNLQLFIVDLVFLYNNNPNPNQLERSNLLSSAL